MIPSPLVSCSKSLKPHFQLCPFLANHEKIANSTKIDKIRPKKSTNVKLELAKILRESGFSKYRHSFAIKKIPWDKIAIDGYTTEQLKGILHDITKATGVVRTLDEVLAFYEANHMKLDIASHPDHPSRPESASIRYIMQNRDKLTQYLQKLKPGEKISWVSSSSLDFDPLLLRVSSWFQTDVFKYGNEKFKSMPEKKREIYLNQYKAAMEEYNKTKQDFFETHPELKIKKKRKVIEKKDKVRAEKVKKPLLLTPFNLYRKELLKQGNPVLSVAQKMWRDLPNDEKGRYIKEVLNMDTDQLKKISKDEMKILDSHNGMPDRPLSAYNIFVKQLKPSYTGDIKEFLKYVSTKWKSLDEKAKNRLQLESNQQTEVWHRNMEAYIRKLPVEQQPMMFSKYNVFHTPAKGRKRKIKEEQNGEAGSKKQSKEGTDDSEDSDDDPKLKKKNKNGELSPAKSPSPKKKKLQEPHYPSPSTAHYFMTKVYEGKPHKIAKAYKKLGNKEKATYRNEMKKLRTEYYTNVGTYIKSLSSDETKAYQLKMEEQKQQQRSELSWHINTGTDDETKRSSSSESDSDDS